jgi:hypothetical protein
MERCSLEAGQDGWVNESKPRAVLKQNLSENGMSCPNVVIGHPGGPTAMDSR